MNVTANPPAPLKLERWDGWGYVLPLFLTTRLFFAAVAIVAPYMLAPHLLSPGLATECSWSDYWLRWDADWYAMIAGDGYSFSADTGSSVAFFPLFPLLIRSAMWLGIDGAAAGMVVSNACTLFLLVTFYRWLRREFDRPYMAETATALLAICPQSCWFLMGYSEPLYLLCVVSALAAARRSDWKATLAWSIATGLTRSNGITLALPLLVIAGPTLLQLWRERRLRAAFGPLLAVIGSWIGHVSYLSFLWWRFGTWQANQIASMAGWGVRLTFSREHLRQKIPGLGFHVFHGSGPWEEWVMWSWLLALMATLMAVAVFWEKRQPLFWTACLASFWSLFFFTTANGWLTGSMGRFAAALFPIAVAMALFAENRRWALPAFFAFNAGTAVFSIAVVFNGYPFV